MSSWLKYILFITGISILITLIIVLLKKKKNIIQYDIQDYSNGLTDDEARQIAQALFEKIDGISATNMDREMKDVLQTNNQDFIRVYNEFYRIAGYSMCEGISNEWFFLYSEGYNLACQIIERCNELNLQ